MKSCDKCENFFCSSKPGSPCERCIKDKWGEGFRRASIPTRIRILQHRIRRLAER